MNIIPSELIAIPDYDGYFWHPQKRCVYSLKREGVLKRLKRTTGIYATNIRNKPGYQLCKNGKKKLVPAYLLQKLTPKDYMVPYSE